jgi:hypothetical protein
MHFLSEEYKGVPDRKIRSGRYLHENLPGNIHHIKKPKIGFNPIFYDLAQTFAD